MDHIEIKPTPRKRRKGTERKVTMFPLVKPKGSGVSTFQENNLVIVWGFDSPLLSYEKEKKVFI